MYLFIFIYIWMYVCVFVWLFMVVLLAHKHHYSTPLQSSKAEAPCFFWKIFMKCCITSSPVSTG